MIHRVLVLSTGLLLASGQQAVADIAETTVRQIVAEPQQFVGHDVRVKGVVKTISYVPEIRDGSSTLSFQLEDGGAELRVVTPFAATLVRKDSVIARGTLFQRADGSLELDASIGDINIQRPEHLRSAAEAEAEAAMKEMPGVPTVIIDTPWSITVSIATLISAVFAMVAAGSLFLHSRRFNIRLDVTHVGIPHIAPAEGGSELHVELRLLSTGSLSFYLRRDITLHMAGISRSASLISGPATSTLLFPVAIRDELVVRLVFILPPNICLDQGTSFTICLRDAFCQRHFDIRGTVERMLCDEACRERTEASSPRVVFA